MKKYCPYNFDIDFQLRTYKNVGRMYELEYKAKEKVWYKICLLIRKVFNRNEKSIKILINIQNGSCMLKKK